MKTRAQISIQRPLNALHRALRQLYAENMPQMVLYGSQARGDQTTESDIDLLLVFPAPVAPGTEIKRISPILSEINLEYQVLIAVYPVSQAQYAQSTGAFWENVRREGIQVYAA